MDNGAMSTRYPHKTAEYTYRVPTPPRIMVPPPSLDQDALPQISLQPLHSQGFHNAVNYNRMGSKIHPQDWTYERRREAQMILPFLFLGPMGAAKDEGFLANTKVPMEDEPSPITMILHIRQKHGLSRLMSDALQRAEERGIEQHTVETPSAFELIKVFPRTTALINAHLARIYQQTGGAGRVLVFCESGNERSAAVVAAYVMENHVDVDHIKAMQLVQTQRFCVNFDDNLKRLLQSYWDILSARRQVEAASAGQDTLTVSVPVANHAPKRGLQHDEGGAMDSEVQDDIQRFGGRGFAPFLDHE